MSRLFRHASRVLMLACCCAMVACSGIQSALDPAGPGAARIDDIWRLMLLVCTAVFALVMMALLWAIARRRRPALDPAAQTMRPDRWRERRMAQVVGAAVAATCSRAIGSDARWSPSRPLRSAST